MANDLDLAPPSLDAVLAYGDQSGASPEAQARAVWKWRNDTRSYGEQKLAEDDPIKLFKGNAALDRDVQGVLDGLKQKLGPNAPDNPLFHAPQSSEDFHPLIAASGKQVGSFQAQPGVSGDMDVLVHVINPKGDDPAPTLIKAPMVTDQAVQKARDAAQEELDNTIEESRGTDSSTALMSAIGFEPSGVSQNLKDKQRDLELRVQQLSGPQAKGILQGEAIASAFQATPTGKKFEEWNPGEDFMKGFLRFSLGGQYAIQQATGGQSDVIWGGGGTVTPEQTKDAIASLDEAVPGTSKTGAGWKVAKGAMETLGSMPMVLNPGGSAVMALSAYGSSVADAQIGAEAADKQAEQLKKVNPELSKKFSDLATQMRNDAQAEGALRGTTMGALLELMPQAKSLPGNIARESTTWGGIAAANDQFNQRFKGTQPDPMSVLDGIVAGAALGTARGLMGMRKPAAQGQTQPTSTQGAPPPADDWTSATAGTGPQQGPSGGSQGAPPPQGTPPQPGASSGPKQGGTGRGSYWTDGRGDAAWRKAKAEFEEEDRQKAAGTWQAPPPKPPPSRAAKPFNTQAEFNVFMDQAVKSGDVEGARDAFAVNADRWRKEWVKTRNSKDNEHRDFIQSIFTNRSNAEHAAQSQADAAKAGQGTAGGNRGTGGTQPAPGNASAAPNRGTGQVEPQPTTPTPNESVPGQTRPSGGTPSEPAQPAAPPDARVPDENNAPRSAEVPAPQAGSGGGIEPQPEAPNAEETEVSPTSEIPAQQRQPVERPTEEQAQVRTPQRGGEDQARAQPAASDKAPEAQNEVITASAVKDGDRIVAARSPTDPHDSVEARNKIPPGEAIRGFLTSEGRFVNRAEAAKIAQVPTKEEPGQLHTQDIASALSELPESKSGSETQGAGGQNASAGSSEEIAPVKKPARKKPFSIRKKKEEPAPPKKRLWKLPGLPPLPEGHAPDIIDYLKKHPIAYPPSKAKIRELKERGVDVGGEYDALEKNPITFDWKRHLFDKDGQKIDQAAQEAHAEGLIRGDTPEDMIAAIHQSIATREANKPKNRTAANDPEKQMEMREQQTIAFERATQDGAVEVDPNELQVGDVMHIDGKPVKVTHVDYDEDGYLQGVTVKDGPEFGVQHIDPSQVLFVEKVDKKPRKAAGDFQLETQTDEQIAAEKAAQAVKERAAAPLRGTAGEMGTPDMLDTQAGETPLFNQAAKPAAPGATPHELQEPQDKFLKHPVIGPTYAAKTQRAVDEGRPVNAAMAQATGVKLPDGYQVGADGIARPRPTEAVIREALNLGDPVAASDLDRYDIPVPHDYYVGPDGVARHGNNWTEATDGSVGGGDAGNPPPPTSGSEQEGFYSGLPIPAPKLRRMNSLDRATTAWSFKLQKSFQEARRAQVAIEKVAKTEPQRAAMALYVEAGGDMAKLGRWATAQPRPQVIAAGGRKFQKVLDAFRKAAKDAMSLNPEQIAVAQKIRQTFDVLHTRGTRAGIINAFRDNYIPHIWNLDGGPGGVASGRRLQKSFRFAKARTFDTTFDGVMEGMMPKTMDISKTLPAYMHEMNSVIADRQFVQDLDGKWADDGRPLIVPRGNVKQIQGDQSDKAYMIAPRKWGEDAVDKNGNKFDQRDYKIMEDQPALTQWLFKGTDTDGNPMFLNSELAVHPDTYRRITAMMGNSKIRRWYNSPSSTWASPIPKALVKFYDKTQSVMKREMFSFYAPFHQVQEGTHAIGHTVNPFSGLLSVDLRLPGPADAARHGLMLMPDRASMHQYIEGVGSGQTWLSRGLKALHIPGLDNTHALAWLGRGAEAYQDYLFHSYIPRLKYTTYEHVLARARKQFADMIAKGEATEDDIKMLSAHYVNSAFGHLNYALMDRSPTIQHFLQMGLLSPDFTWGRALFAGQAVKGMNPHNAVGREQLRAMGILAAVMAGGAFTLAQVFGGKWDAKDPFSVTFGNRTFQMRSVPEDIWRFIRDTKNQLPTWLGGNSRRTGNEFVTARINPTLQSVQQAIEGVNFRGEKVKIQDTGVEALGKFLPITLRQVPGLRDLTDSSHNSPVPPLQQFIGSLGIKASRFSPITGAYELANEWKEKNGVPSDYKGTYPVSQYQQLRYAIEDGDIPKAAQEYKELLKKEKPDKLAKGFAASVNHPFTGSKANDAKFARSLTGEDKAVYDAAVDRRRMIMNTFPKVREEANKKQP